MTTTNTLGNLIREIVWDRRLNVKLTSNDVVEILERDYKRFVNASSVNSYVSDTKATIAFLRKIGALEARFFEEASAAIEESKTLEDDPAILIADFVMQDDAAAKREARNARRREARAAKKTVPAAQESDPEEDPNVIDFTQLAA